MASLSKFGAVALTALSLLTGTLLSLSKPAVAGEVVLDDLCHPNQKLQSEGAFVNYQSAFKANRQSYWFSAARYLDGAVLLCISKYATRVKRQLDELKEQFKNWQQRQEESTPTAIAQKHELVVNPAEVEVNADIADIEQVEEIDTTEQEQNTTGFTDEEFETERIMWLLNRIYAAEKQSQEIPISVEEFLQQYNERKRDFTGINLMEANLSEKSLSGVNLSAANLKKAELYKTNFTSSNLSDANLVNADLHQAILD